MSSARDAGTVVVTGTVIVTGKDTEDTTGMDTEDTASMDTGIGVIAIAGMYGVADTRSASAADRQ